jgi:predicted polyphosphate/ATP-dependent NAD kinase
VSGVVGIIANPAAGKDIRRLVAYGRTIANYEKVGMVQRVLLALDAVGVERVMLMPDSAQLAQRSLEGIRLALHAEILPMDLRADERDTTRAAELMAEAGAACIVTLGGDGTNRAAARESSDVPLVPISTGTNNVFPTMVEPTMAGLAAGLVATGQVPLERVSAVQKRLDVYVDGALVEIALIDVAVSREHSVGARAIWDLGTVDELFLTCAEPTAMGMSAVGAQLRPLGRDEPGGLYVRIGEGSEVLAAIAPGVLQRVRVAHWRLIEAGEHMRVRQGSGTIAVDGERQLPISTQATVEVALNPHGPRVVDVGAALRDAAAKGALVLPRERQA